ncbi:hypothetical protein Btru_070676 [Bulinus truncatus]|nr:hypothetical protein Btru_070676 [Bulinus truncatus]
MTQTCQSTYTAGYFIKHDDTTIYGSSPLGDAWTVSSVTSCVTECRELYTGCYSVVYNDQSQLCTPGGPITYGMSPPSSLLGDKFYYTDYCNTSLGYKLFVYKSVVDCLHISPTWAVYLDARNNCTATGGRVMQAKTQDRYDLFKHIARDVIKFNTFLGLTDLVTEGTFVWEDGEVLNNTWKTHIFFPGEPNDADGKDDCAILGVSNNFQDIYDGSCSYTTYPDYRYYICESVM